MSGIIGTIGDVVYNYLEGAANVGTGLRETVDGIMAKLDEVLSKNDLPGEVNKVDDLPVDKKDPNRKQGAQGPLSGMKGPLIGGGR